MSELKFIVKGQEVTAHQFEATAQKRQPRKSEALKAVHDRAVAKVSLGFIVVGYSPKHYEERIADHCAASLAFAQDPTKNKAPGTLEEYTRLWLAKNKPKRVRSKPYEIESAADLCAEMAKKAGWLHVQVDELLRG